MQLLLKTNFTVPSEEENPDISALVVNKNIDKTFTINKVTGDIGQGFME